MASLQTIIPGGFNSAAVEPQAAFDNTPIPAGLYTVEITGSEIKPVNNGTGLNLEFTVIDPEQYAKRKVWSLLCIQHTNSQTEQIAQAQLSAICRAVGIVQLNDSDDLFQRLLCIRTKIRPAGPGRDGKHYDARAEVTGYEAAGASSQPQQRQAAPAAQAAPAKAPPWAKKAA
jgi:hypothetical protein